MVSASTQICCVIPAPWGGPGAQMGKINGSTYPLACVQFHSVIEAPQRGRD